MHSIHVYMNVLMHVRGTHACMWAVICICKCMYKQNYMFSFSLNFVACTSSDNGICYVREAMAWAFIFIIGLSGCYAA